MNFDDLQQLSFLFSLSLQCFLFLSGDLYYFLVISILFFFVFSGLKASDAHLEKLKCRVCDFQAYYEQQYQDHILVHEEVTKCKCCKFASFEKDTLIEHYKVGDHCGMSWFSDWSKHEMNGQPFFCRFFFTYRKVGIKTSNYWIILCWFDYRLQIGRNHYCDIRQCIIIADSRYLLLIVLLAVYTETYVSLS